jgi:hypothetical protein
MNKKYYYPKNQHTYIVLNDNIKMKNPDTGEWIDAVLYTDSTGAEYVRSKIDFLAKFVELVN